jgi:hypothetical protein
VEAGRLDGKPPSHIDVAPSILDFSGTEPPDIVPGCSLLSRLADPDAAEARPAFMQFHRFSVHTPGGFAEPPLRHGTGLPWRER